MNEIHLPALPYKLCSIICSTDCYQARVSLPCHVKSFVSQKKTECSRPGFLALAMPFLPPGASVGTEWCESLELKTNTTQLNEC